MLIHLDLRWLTALVQMALGFSLVVLALHVWWMPTTRRADLFGPYLTGEGIRFMLRGWPLVFIAGLFLFVTGMSKGVYYERWHGDISSEVANAIGLLEAIFALWAMGSVTVVGVRAWRGG